MVSGILTSIPQNSIRKTTVWHKTFSHISHNFLNKIRLVPISHIFHTDLVILVNAYFHYLPMISGSLRLVPQNSITESTVWHKKFSHISDNFVNKMQFVPIFQIWPTNPVFLVCLFHHLPMMPENLTPIPQNSIAKGNVWQKKFSHIQSHNFVNKM